MSRLLSVESQVTINGVTVIDRTTSVVDDNDNSVAYYVLIINGHDNTGRPMFVTYHRHNKIQHLILKDKWLKKLSKMHEPKMIKEYDFIS